MKQRAWRHLAVRSTAFAAMALSLSTRAGVPSFSEVPALKGDPEFCMSKDDGTYAHPDCRVRYSCKRGMASQVNCPDGQVFNEDANPSDNSSVSYCSAPVANTDCRGIKAVN